MTLCRPDVDAPPWCSTSSTKLLRARDHVSAHPFRKVSFKTAGFIHGTLVGAMASSIMLSAKRAFSRWTAGAREESTSCCAHCTAAQITFGQASERSRVFADWPRSASAKRLSPGATGSRFPRPNARWAARAPLSPPARRRDPDRPWRSAVDDASRHRGTRCVRLRRSRFGPPWRAALHTPVSSPISVLTSQSHEQAAVHRVHRPVMYDDSS